MASKILKRKSEPSKWTTDMESSFIELLRHKDNIWNVKSSLYKHRTLRKVSFNEIRERLAIEYPLFVEEFTLDKLQKKYSSLKTIFQRNKNKLKNIPSGAGYQAIVPWVHFTALMFLEDCVEAEESSSNLDISFLSQSFRETDDDSSVILGQETPMVQEFDASSGDKENVEPSEDFAEDCENSSDIFIEEVPLNSSKEQAPTKLKAPTSTCSKRPAKRKRKSGTPDVGDELLTEAVKALKSSSNNSKEFNFEDACGQYVAQILKSIPDVEKRHQAHKKIINVALECLLE